MTMASDTILLNLRSARRLRASVAAVALTTLLAGCSSAPDWADPGEWFSDSEAPEASSRPNRQAEPAEGFPNLSSVPGEAPAASSSADRESLNEGLTADRSNARYSDQPLTAESTLIPPAAPPPSAVRRPAAPAAAPSAPAAPAAPAVAPRAAAPAAPAPAAPASNQTAAAPPPPPPTPAAPGTTARSAASSSSAPAARQPAAPQASASRSELPPAFPARAQSNSASNYVPPTFEPPRYQLPGRSAGQATQQAARPQVPGVPAGTPSGAAGQLTAVIYFGHGSSGLDSNDMKVLRDVVAIQRQNNARIIVVGHSSSRTGSTDAVSHRVANLETSLKRANAVASALTRLGVPKGQVVTEARSDNQPVFHEFMPTGEAGNRRAEIYLAY